MTDLETRPSRLTMGLAALALLGAAGIEQAPAAPPRDPRADALPTRAELDTEIEPGRLIYENGLRRRRLSFESVIKQAMDRNYSQPMIEEIAKQFGARRYRPVTVALVSDQPMVVQVHAGAEGGLPGGPGTGRPPPPEPMPGLGGGGGDYPGTGVAPPPTMAPTAGGGGEGGLGSGVAPPAAPPRDIGPMARDLENGIHNAILSTLKEKGHNLVALNVFAQTMDLVKVIVIVATRQLPDERIRPTLRDVRQVIEREVLAARYPGVHLAELSSFTLLNERDGHFYEHPVLYWQLGQGQPGGGGPIVPGRLPGESPGFEGVATGPVRDYFSSGEFEPEEDFDEQSMLGGPLGGM